MKREIKFRIWSDIFGEMFYPESLGVGEWTDNKGVMEGWYLRLNGELRGQFLTCGDVNCDEEFELMQFAGLKDKEGGEIYEGDIVEYTEKTCELGDAQKYVGVVVYESESACFGLAPAPDKDCWNYFSDYVISDFKIIGNIFENPELLKQD